MLFVAPASFTELGKQGRETCANACDIMRREGLTTMDYMEQILWPLFLKSFGKTNASVGLSLDEGRAQVV